MCKLFEKEAKFEFNGDSLLAFNYLKEKLVSASIIVALNWVSPFELICDASGLELGAVLGQWRDKLFYPIYYASKSYIMHKTIIW